MLNSEILLSVVGLLISAYAVNSSSNKKKTLKENFGMLPSMDVKVDRQVAENRQEAALGNFQSIQNNYQSMLNPHTPFYTVPGAFQSQLAPRMFGGDYGANITYNLPSRQNLAVPETPLDHANYIEENYQGPSCNSGGEELSYHGGAPLMPPAYADGNYNETMRNVYKNPNVSSKASHANLPVSDMTTINELGQEDQPIVYDRFIIANTNSRLRSQGDFFRGDLPIAPQNNGWFNVSVQPNIDLQQGAMNVMGGINNETTQQLADLIYTTSGNSKTTIAGMNMQNQLANPSSTKYSGMRTNNYRTNNLNNVNMGNQYNTKLSAANGDINVMNYP